MNKRQKIVQEAFLDNEEAVIKRLKQVYGKSLSDITAKAERLQKEFEELSAEYDTVEDEAEREILKSRMQSKVYQKKYQEGLKKQVNDILNDMQAKEYKTVSDYLNQCYEEGFVGAMYDLQGQGIPMCFPLDQEAMVQAVQLDSPISQGLYSRLGEDVSILKKKITAQVSRGIATGMTYSQVAKQLSGYTNIGFNNAVRIARTEGHRIQAQSAMNACYKAKEKGADVVKQWDSTLDAKTRESHAMVDREIKELDEKFSNGLMYPGDPSGGAAEVVNCRCALKQRGRWALEGGFTKMNNFTKQLESFESPEDYKEFKKAFFSKENRNYMNYVEEMEDKYKTKNFEKVLGKMSDREYKRMMDLQNKSPWFNKNVLTNNVKSDIIPPEKSVFVPVKDMKEAKARFSSALGIPEDKINLGRMKPELTNQYLEGVEMFMKEFPELKGYYGILSTKTGAPSVVGLNKLKGHYIDINGARYIKYESELHFKNPQDLGKMMNLYAEVSKNGESYANASPLSTAIHELVHGIDRAITLKKYGAFNSQGLNGEVYGSNHGQATAGVSHKIITRARDEMFGAQYGQKVADETRYLGRYARTSKIEELAEAVSYEFVNPSNPYSARILELFREEVKGAFGK